MDFEKEIEKLQNGKLLKKAYIRGLSEKACNCKNRTILVDSRNHVLECKECGAILNPFKVVSDMCFGESLRIDNIKSLEAQKSEIIKWMNRHQEPIKIKKFLENFRSNNKHGLHPTCPKCREVFSIDDLNQGCWTSVNVKEKL